jgi:periplasmic protein TonB
VTAATFVYAPDRRGEILRWSGAAVVILLAHLAAGVVYQLRERTPVAQAEMPAIEIDLTPPQVEQPAPALPMPLPEEDVKPDELPPPEPQAMAQPQDPPPPEPQVVEQPQEPPPPEAQVTEQPQELLPPEPQVAEQPQEPLPEPPPPEPEPVQAEQLPPEPPPPPKPVEVQPKEPTIVTPPPKPVVKPEPRRPPKPASTPKPTTAPQVAVASAGAAVGQADWRSRVMGILGRAKRYPSAAEARHETGTVHLSFTVDRNGRVLSRNIARSSGFAALDQEVLSMLDRVQLPPFPPEMTQLRMTVTAPVHFSLR